MLNSDICTAIGLHIHEFDEMKDPEVAEFRRHILEICQESVTKREENGKESQALYAYPPETENSPQLPPSMEGKLDKGHIKIAIWSLSQVRRDFFQRYAIIRKCAFHINILDIYSL